jgi:hypothetical protein
MIEGQEVMELINSPYFCWRSTNRGSFSIDMCGCIFHSLNVWYNFCNAFVPKPPADRRWSGDHSLRNTDPDYPYIHLSILPSVCVFKTQSQVWCTNNTVVRFYINDDNRLFPGQEKWSNLLWISSCQCCERLLKEWFNLKLNLFVCLRWDTCPYRTQMWIVFN